MSRSQPRFSFTAFIFVVLFSFASFASSETKITQENFDSTYRQLQTEYQELETTLPSRLKRRATNHNNSRRQLKSSQAQKLSRYLELKKQVKTYKPIFELKEALNAMYFKNAPASVDRNAVNLESTRLAFGVIDEIKRLRKKYKSFFMPIVHNMMIDVGIKKRGACKHWAEDLLDYMRPVKRNFFFVTWGEANPRKMTEHNVAVVYAKHDTFNEGLLIDPWRTAGKPFWIGVKDDPHYKWNKWDLYPIH